MGSVADTTILSWITAEVDQALETVRRNIARYITVREDPALLKACPEHLHQVSGALRMVGLTGATRFCELLERSFGAPGSAPPAAHAMEIIDRSVLALKEFVNELARGQTNVPLRLFPAYRDLARLNGDPQASEKDLFFPDLRAEVPAHGEPRSLPPAARAEFVQAQRVAFERGLLSWLRNPPAGLDEMRAAVEAMHQAAIELPEPRGLWWTAGALVDALAQPPDADWLKGAKAICHRIDLQIRDLAAGAGQGDPALMREILYAVARAQPHTPRIKEVKQLYQLDALLPGAGASGGAAELDIQFLEVALYDLHSRLAALKSAWVRYVSGERASGAQFRDLVASFKAKAAELGNPHLIKLLGAIALVAGRLPDPCPRQNQFMVIEMASAFLLVEYVVDHFTAPAPELDQQIVLMGGWLLDAEKGKSTGEPPAGLRPELTQKIGALQLRAQVAKEIMANLQHVEQVLDAFARDAATREALPALEMPLRQIHGALTVVGFARAAQALKLCERMIDACADPGYTLAERDMDWIAEGLSSIGFFLTPCLHGRDPADQALALFFSRFDEARTSSDTAPPDITVTLPPAAAAEAKPDPAPGPAPAPSADPQLLEIFLDEASEVLGRIDASVPQCEAQPADLEALTTIRRGFHTLKGSGRMVGLMDFGEAAWQVEQALNAWLEEKRPATAALLAFVSEAAESFKGWVEELRAGSPRQEIDCSRLAALAAKLKDPAPQPDFLDIYSKEAAEHIAALETGFASWRGGAFAKEFMRAAHTLASSSRTAGFDAIADLAGAIEQWLPFAALSLPQEGERVGEAIAKLKSMVGLASRRAPLEPDPVAVESLQAYTERHKQVQTQPRVQTQPQVQTQPKAQTQPKVQTPPPAPRVREIREETPREKRAMRDDIDAQLLPIFLEEAQELVPTIGSDLRDWKASPGDAEVQAGLQRALHTLKGSARMAGAIRLGELTHLMESRIEQALGAQAFPPELFDELDAMMDRLSGSIERLRAGESTAQLEIAAEPAAPAAMLRINAETLDRMINETGEVAIARSRIEAELRAVKQALSDLGDSVARLRGQLREVEVQADSQMQSRLTVMEKQGLDYDPLEFDRYTRLQELTRLMAESLSDVLAVQQALIRNTGETEAALAQQARITRGVQQELMHMRAVPFSNLNERLYRVVRQVARELDRKAELEIAGAEIELDRSVLERIAAPLEHLLRNAVAHGVEAPAARVAAGKPEAGRIGVTLRQEANEVALVVEDDGAGLDLERLWRKGVQMGLAKPDERPADSELAQLIFASGLSTAEAVTEIAGRGVGMDVVRNDIAAIGGRVEVATRKGQGVTFTLYLPLTLAVTQALLVRSGPSVLALASGMIEQVLRLKAEAIAPLYEKGQIESQGRVYPLHYLQHLLGLHAGTQIQPYNSVLLLRSGVQRAAVHVDALMGNQEIVVKNIGPQLARVPGVTGATVLADGRIALIVNPVQLAQAPRELTRTAIEAAAAEATAAPPAPLVMVVDDSLTVRKVTGRLLEREGYRVLTAKDGVDALERLKDERPAAMLVDIEMPRMDGFELTRHVRGDPRTAGVPIIVISSRTAEKHRAEAAQLGVNAFLGKPYEEAALLGELARAIAA